MGKAAREVPRWKRRKQQQPAATVIQLRGRQARRFTREVAATPAQDRGKEGTATASGALAHSGAWRFRKHLAPFGWLAGLIAASGLRAAPHPLLCGLAASAVIPVLMVLFTRHLPPWTRRAADVAALVTSVWVLLLAAVSLRSCIAWMLLTWAPLAALWVRHYRWRPQPADPAPAAGRDDDAATWAALCEQQKWNARLGTAEMLGGGGCRYPVQCDGVKTVMKKILAQPDHVAGAWHSPVTEVYAERDPKGVTSRGFLTILPGNSLQASGWWDGAGMDPATGLVRAGRFADGSPAHMKWYTPRYGTRHDLISGTTGSGKTALLDLYCMIALTSGCFVPVICDPQEGQSLPFWRDKCLYASGVGQVERLLRGLHAGFLDRSSYLATLPWVDDGVRMPGMPFFDYELTGLPMPLIILDEAHMVLKDGSRQQRAIRDAVLEMARLIRKTGGKMTLATQLPSLEDLGGKQALRDMLRGGNVWSGRTANKVASGMLGLVKDPSEIPRYFGDGEETAGLGYMDGPDNRPDAPMRTDRVGKEHYRNPPQVRQLDDRFLEVMDRAMKTAVSPTSAVAPVPAAARNGQQAGGLGKLLQHPPQDDTPEPEAAQEGRRCIDAVWQVLSDRNAEMTRGEVIKWTGDLARSWGRKPWSIKAIQLALTGLAEGKDPARPVIKPRDGVYRTVAGDSAQKDQETGAA
jgi:hypothetical protein